MIIKNRPSINTITIKGGYNISISVEVKINIVYIYMYIDIYKQIYFLNHRQLSIYIKPNHRH